ncbi:MAG: magnesium transporter [Bacteroidota bacterium]|nr:magnesium transporter [Bacteroidota bacterium]
MPEITEAEKVNLLHTLLKEAKIEELTSILQEMPTVEVAEFLQHLEDEKSIKFLLKRFAPTYQGRIFSDFDEEIQLRLVDQFDKREFALIFTHMSSDIRADLYQELSAEQQTSLLPFLDKNIREDVISLSSYPPETAGGIMNTDFATILNTMSVEQAIEKIRKDAPSKKMVYYNYVVDEQQKLVGFLTLRDLILANPKDLVADKVHERYVSAEVTEDRESVAQKIAKYDLLAIPVVNAQGQLAGIVSHDDAIDVIRAEHTEDMEKFMGIVPDDDGLSYLDTSTVQHFRKRIVWLVGLAAVGIISGAIVHAYEATIETLLILALYMPMMADTGGNAGSQAATVVIRAIALGEVKLSSWFKIIFKEIRIALLVSLCLGGLAYIKIYLLSTETTLPDGLNLSKVAIIISLALGIQVISSSVIGAGLPLIVKKLGGDPAVAASPAITTIVDITGLLIYFGMATAFLL